MRVNLENPKIFPAMLRKLIKLVIFLKACETGFLFVYLYSKNRFFFTKRMVLI